MGKRKTENTASAVSIAAPTEENFPRGGASTLTPLEHREISNKVANDLFVSVRIQYCNILRTELTCILQSKETATEAVAVDGEEPAKKKRKPSKKTKTAVKTEEKPKSENVYIEQLNFKVKIQQQPDPSFKLGIFILSPFFFSIETYCRNCLHGLYFSHQ